jgi:thioredoxin 1
MAIVHVNEENFEAEVLKSEQPVIVDFFAEWCGPCRVMGPIFEEVSGKFEGKVKFAKLNVDEANAISGKYGVMSIPTLIVFKNGEAAETLVGLQDEVTLEDKAKSLV